LRESGLVASVSDAPQTLRSPQQAKPVIEIELGQKCHAHGWRNAPLVSLAGFF
jgi:hypothetical protein